MEERLAKTGVSVFVVNDQMQILLGVRKSIPGFGNGKWQLPGGELQHMESWDNCCKREVLEETSLVIENVEFITAIEDMHIEADQHYVTGFFVASVLSGEAQVTEPDKCEKWEWFNIEELLPWMTFLDIQDVLDDFYDKIYDYIEQER